MNAIAAQIQMNHVMTYSGAGLSMSLYPGWTSYIESLPHQLDKEMSRKIKETLENSDVSAHQENPCAGLAQEIYDRYPHFFEDQTKEIFHPDKIHSEKLGEAVKLLPQLFRCPMITTNLDRVLETVYEEQGIHLETAFAGSVRLMQESIQNHTPCLWKIHGDIKHPDTWVITQKQYEAQYQCNDEHDAQSFTELFSVYLQASRLLFLGCSLKDDKIVELLSKEFHRNPSIRHFAILELPPEDSFVTRFSELDKMGIDVIWYENKDGTHHEVADILKELLILTGPLYTSNYFPPEKNRVSEIQGKKNESPT